MIATSTRAPHHARRRAGDASLRGGAGALKRTDAILQPVQTFVSKRLLACFLLLSAARLLAAEPECVRNFHAGGSLFTRAYTSSASFPNLDVRTAVRRLKTHLPAQNIEVTRADDIRGEVEGKGSGNQDALKIRFVIGFSGTTMVVNVRIDAPTPMLSEQNARAALCNALDLVAKPVASEQPQQRSSEPIDRPAPKIIRSGAIEESSAQWSGRWVADQRTGCKVWFDGAKSGESVTWSGKCGADGRATGPGTVTFRRDGILVWKSEITGTNGYAMESGHETVRIPAGLPVEVSCPAPLEIAFVRVDVPKNIDLAEPWIVRALIRESIRLVNGTCKQLRPDQTYHVDMSREWGGPYGAEIGWAGNANEVNKDISISQIPTSKRVEEYNEIRRREIAAKAQGERRREEMEANVAAANAHQKNVEKRNALASKYGVSEFVTPHDLKTNPFRLQGKTVAFGASFVEMSGAGTAVFENVRSGDVVVVTGMPATLFKARTGEVVIVVGRVVGKTAGDRPLVRYSAVVHCAARGCEDYAIPR